MFGEFRVKNHHFIAKKSNVWIYEIIENVQELKLSRMSLEFVSIHI
jgi:hypothetical protein